MSIQIQLALLQQSVQTVLTRLDEQNRAMVHQADSMNTRWSHSLANAEQRWMAALNAKLDLNDQKLVTIRKDIDAKAGQTEFHIVRGLVFGLTAIVLIAFATAVTKSVLSHEARPAAVHATILTPVPTITAPTVTIKSTTRLT